MKRNFNLEKEMSKNSEVISYLKDDDIAREFYSSLCNMQWSKIVFIPEDERIINTLKGEDPTLWSCSWRHAGGIIADIRNVNHNNGKQEDYMDFYCSGKEGYVSDRVGQCFLKMGWKPVEWDDDLI